MCISQCHDSDSNLFWILFLSQANSQALVEMMDVFSDNVEEEVLDRGQWERLIPLFSIKRRLLRQCDARSKVSD